jgi:hypothetical protein
MMVGMCHAMIVQQVEPVVSVSMTISRTIRSNKACDDPPREDLKVDRASMQYKQP